MRRMFLMLGAAVALSAIAAPALAQGTADPPKYPVFLYVDTVNGTAPAGTKPRPIGCTQTNYFARGERPVFRVWGSEAAPATSCRRRTPARYVRSGQPNLKLNWARTGQPPTSVALTARGPSPRPTRSAPPDPDLKTENNTFGTVRLRATIVPLASKK
jgi:hypothetical protein